MVQRCTSRQRSIPLSREGPNGGKGGSGIRVPVSPIRRGFAPGFVNNKKGALAAASDKVYQLLAQGRWFSPSTPASSTTKTASHGLLNLQATIPSAISRFVMLMLCQFPSLSVHDSAVRTKYLYLKFI